MKLQEQILSVEKIAAGLQENYVALHPTNRTEIVVTQCRGTEVLLQQTYPGLGILKNEYLKSLLHYPIRTVRIKWYYSNNYHRLSIYKAGEEQPSVHVYNEKMLHDGYLRSGYEPGIPSKYGTACLGKPFDYAPVFTHRIRFIEPVPYFIVNIDAGNAITTRAQ